MRLAVIGGVAAGLSAAARARRLDPSLEITVLERGPTVSHGACGLPYFVEGIIRSADQLVTYDAAYFKRERNIEVRAGVTVAQIEHGRRQVRLEGGEIVRYDRLVIATGAAGSKGIQGTEAPHVFSLHTPADAVRLRDFLVSSKPRRGVVIGSGYIGLEAVEALRVHGVRVTLMDHCGCVLGRPDDHLVSVVKKHLERFGVEVDLTRNVAGASELPADVVVVAAGMRPNVDLAAEAGIELGRSGAIRTDERMETNLNGIYAAGDCTESRHIVTGQPVWIPLGTTANKMGRVAGANAAGGRERFPGVCGTSVVRVCGLGIAFTGLCVSDARAAGFEPVSVRIEARDRAGYFQPRPVSVELIADRRSRRLVGGTVIEERNPIGRINVLATALAGRMTVEDLLNLDLAYAPPYAPVWDAVLVAAQQLAHQL